MVYQHKLSQDNVKQTHWHIPPSQAATIVFKEWSHYNIAALLQK